MSYEEYSKGMGVMMNDREFLYRSLTRDLYSQGIVLGRKYHLLRIAYNVLIYGIIISVLAFVIIVMLSMYFYFYEQAYFFFRDISWLSFNERILQEAAKAAVPLMEPIKFLSIYSSNLNEFYRVCMLALLTLQKADKYSNSQSVYRQAAAIINEQQNVFDHILNYDIIAALANDGYIFL